MEELCVKVFLRPHPEVTDDANKVFSLDYSSNVVQDKITNRSYEFDGVLPPHCTQEQVYTQVVQPLVAAVQQGYNATVLAYGQTGSGKTFTMGTGSSSDSSPQNKGILQRALAELLIPSFSSTPAAVGSNQTESKSTSSVGVAALHTAEANLDGKVLGDDENGRSSPEEKSSESSVSKSEDDFDGLQVGGANLFEERAASSETAPPPASEASKIFLSFLEVYNEKVYDLLTPSRTQLATRHDMAGGLQAAGCQEQAVDSVASAETVLEMATARRSVAATSLNAHSSRSHALVGVKLKKCTRTCVLWLVDLAGSESVGRQYQDSDSASCSSDRKLFTEGVAINKGLLALGKVLTARAAGRTHVPYRDSILTHLLRESVCGDSRTAMIACARLAHASHTRTTLLYAEQTRNVRTRPVQQLFSARKMLKRRFEDPTATPNVIAKRRLARSAGRGSLVTPFASGASKRKNSSVARVHNRTVSTPGHTPAPAARTKAMDRSLQTSNREGSSSGKRQSPLLFPSLQQPLFEEESSPLLQSPPPLIGGVPSSTRPHASSPIQGISKLPRQAPQADMSSLISPLASRLEKSIMSKMSDTIVDTLMARMTRSRTRKFSLAKEGKSSEAPSVSPLFFSASSNTASSSTTASPCLPRTRRSKDLPLRASPEFNPPGISIPHKNDTPCEDKQQTDASGVLREQNAHRETENKVEIHKPSPTDEEKQTTNSPSTKKVPCMKSSHTPSSPRLEEEDGEAEGSPDLGTTLFEAMFSTPGTRGRQKRRIEGVLQRMVLEAVHRSPVKRRPRRSMRLAEKESSNCEKDSTTIDSPPIADTVNAGVPVQEGFLVPTGLPPARRRKRGLTSLPQTSATREHASDEIGACSLQLQDSKDDSVTDITRGSTVNASLMLEPASKKRSKGTFITPAVSRVVATSRHLTSTVMHPTHRSLCLKNAFEESVIEDKENEFPRHSVEEEISFNTSMTESESCEPHDVSRRLGNRSRVSGHKFFKSEQGDLNESLQSQSVASRSRRRNTAMNFGDESFMYDDMKKSNLKTVSVKMNVLGDVSNMVNTTGILDTTSVLQSTSANCRLNKSKFNADDLKSLVYDKSRSCSPTDETVLENTYLDTSGIYNTTVLNNRDLDTTDVRLRFQGSKNKSPDLDASIYVNGVRRSTRVAKSRNKTILQDEISPLLRSRGKRQRSSNSSSVKPPKKLLRDDAPLNTTKISRNPRAKNASPSVFNMSLFDTKPQSKKSAREKLNVTTTSFNRASKGNLEQRAGDYSYMDTTAYVVSPSVVRNHAQQVLDVLNSGDSKSLQRLPTIGPKTATIICNHRKFFGAFSSVQEATSIPGLPRAFAARFAQANTLT